MIKGIDDYQSQISEVLSVSCCERRLITQADRCYNCVHLLNGPSNSFTMGNETPILAGRSNIERQNAITKKIVLNAINRSTKMTFARTLCETFQSKKQFS